MFIKALFCVSSICSSFITEIPPISQLHPENKVNSSVVLIACFVGVRTPMQDFVFSSHGHHVSLAGNDVSRS